MVGTKTHVDLSGDCVIPQNCDIQKCGFYSKKAVATGFWVSYGHEVVLMSSDHPGRADVESLNYLLHEAGQISPK